MPGAPLSLPEREEIFLALCENPETSWASIARRVDRAPTTVARQVDRHDGRTKYRPATPDRLAQRARRRWRGRLAAVPVELCERIVGELREGRSPGAIGADLQADQAPVIRCVETIYQAIYTGTLGVRATECLRTRRPRRRCSQTRNPNKRPGLANIAKHPDSVNDRDEVGHWEIDQIIGARNQSSLLTFTERLTRYAIGITMPEGYDAHATLAGLTEGFDHIPSGLLRSVTFDQGSEWAEWETLKATYNIDVWFCDPVRHEALSNPAVVKGHGCRSVVADRFKAEGSPTSGTRGRAASSPDNAGTGQHRQMACGPASETERRT